MLNSVVVLFHFNYSLYDYVFDDAYKKKYFMSEMMSEKVVNNLDWNCVQIGTGWVILSDWNR